MNINLLEILAAIVGLIYLILEYKASAWLWLFGVISPILYIYEFYIYYVIACIYGIMVWKGMIGKSQNNEEPSIGSIPRRYVFPTIIITLVLCIAIPLVLKLYTNSTVWLFDGISTALSIVGMWMLAKKYYQQWILWIIVEPIVIATSLQAEMYATVLLYVVYTVIAFMGYIKWKKEALK